jgi:hypothetical protein
LQNAFTESERRALLDDFFQALEEMNKASDACRDTGAASGSSLDAKLVRLQQRVSDLWDEYLERVPFLPLSRCPFTGDKVLHSIDPYGIDGLWWNYDASIRPTENLPPTYFALAGAMKLADEVESFPFLCKPGPEVPYVVPRLLQRAEIRAVISSIRVGAHQGFPIFYFADPVPYDIERINTWGANVYTFLNEEGKIRWNVVYDTPEDFDFELEKWINAGKLLWIAPGDEQLTLHSEVGHCPYLGLSGRRSILRIQNNEVWTGEEFE